MSKRVTSRPVLLGTLEDHFYLPVATSRLHVLHSAFLLLLSFDIWLELAGHAGRYGAGDFNLAHFAWLDAVQPLPSPALYLGVTFGAGLLSFVGAWLPQPRWVRGLLCASYTYGWAMSLHDSYQHHYLISLVLFCFVFFPRTALAFSDVDNSGSEDKPSVVSEASAIRITSDEAPAETWAYPMLTSSVAIVYFYAAFAKLDPAWQAGDAFVRVAPEHARAFFEFGAGYDLSQATVLSLIGTSVVGIQVILGAVYLAAPWFDRGVSNEKLRTWLMGSTIGLLTTIMLLSLGEIRSSAAGEYLPELAFVFIAAALAGATLRWHWTRWFALFAALSFHFGAEELGLKIGWFSYYMIMMALVCLGPRALSAWIFGLARDVALTVAELGFKERGVIVVILVLCVSAAIALAAKLDMPGVTLGIGWAAIALCADPLRRLSQSARPAALTGAITLMAGCLMWFSVVNSDVRFDYYRYLGGDLRRRGDLDGALDAYVRANRYAPEGEDRKEKEEQLRRVLGR